MKSDSVQITKMENGYLVSAITKPNQFTRVPGGQMDYVFKEWKEVLDFLEDKT